jgi:hypothetical protein
MLATIASLPELGTIALNRKPIALHTTLILIHQASAVLLRFVATGEEHAIVSCLLFVFADAAGLVPC